MGDQRTVRRHGNGRYQSVILTQLGRQDHVAGVAGRSALETVPNSHPGARYVVRFTCPEFTALCPVTGQPDFAHLVIDYVPKECLVESKSLKLFLGAFRSHGAFHEDCTLTIAKRLEAALEPVWLRIGGYWYPRAACRSTCSIRATRRRRTCGCPTRACRRTGHGADGGQRPGLTQAESGNNRGESDVLMM
jgi:7-cyano-7-deazaguanine reductase